ncbi:hypothetical protein AC578_8875 [Pseudocercospora eumusae]|uniref:Uncharacterized protein n=1 Tax=Pseudocercospora eumusae TaxID=321146 RepID=A0A139HBT7_9PEZI|nr:hypothetical protein AC578_8875 [Pseudocercospora eumusae]
MRQFMRHITNSKHQHDDYWKLQSYNSMTAQQMRELLQKRRYAVGKSDSKDKLEEALLRSDCGMQSYADQSDDDLRALVRSRGVDASHVICGNKVGTRGDLLSLLKNADMNPRFEKFSDLAAELRNKIYEHYFSEIRQSLYAPSEPPITRVSRDIRQETIKMYYDSCTFDFVLRLPKTSQALGRRSLQAHARRLTIPSQMRLFMSSVSPNHLAYVRKVNIQLVPHHERESAYQNDAHTALSIEVSEEGLDFTVESDQLFYILQDHGQPTSYTRFMFMGRLSDEATRIRAHQALLQIGLAVDKIAQRDGKARLKLDDLYDMRAAIEAGL